MTIHIPLWLLFSGGELIVLAVVFIAGWFYGIKWGDEEIERIARMNIDEFYQWRREYVNSHYPVIE